MTRKDSDVPQDDPTKKPKAPRHESESTPPSGGDSMQPPDSGRPAAAPDGKQRRDDESR